MSSDEEEEAVYYQRPKGKKIPEDPPTEPPVLTRTKTKKPEQPLARTKNKKEVYVDKEVAEVILANVTQNQIKKAKRELNKDKPKQEKSPAQKKAFADMLQRKKEETKARKQYEQEQYELEQKKKIRVGIKPKQPRTIKKPASKPKVNVVDNYLSETEDEVPTEDITTDPETKRYVKQAKKKIQKVREVDQQMQQLRQPSQQQQPYNPYGHLFKNW